MITWADIEAISGHAGMSDAEVAAALNANSLHVRNTYITGGPANTASVNLLHLLTARYRVLFQNSKQEWIGPLVTLAESDAGVAQVMAVLYPHLQVKDSQVFCAESVDAANMVNALVASVGGILDAAGGEKTSSDLIADVAVLTGGRRYGSVTVEQVATVRAEQAKSVALAAVQSRVDAVLEAAREEFRREGSTPESITEAAEGAW